MRGDYTNFDETILCYDYYYVIVLLMDINSFLSRKSKSLEHLER